MTEINDISYLQSWSTELIARSNRVRDLIGNAHWLSDGKHKEAILRDFLSRYLPREIVIGTGFIRCSEISPEIDILLTDWRRHPPLFNEGGLQIVAKKSVVGVIEVKSTFTSKSLADAIDALVRTNLIIGDSLNTWSSCIFANCKKKFKSFISSCDSRLQRVVDNNVENAKALPKCIICFSNYICFIGVDFRFKKLETRYFNLGELSLASGLIDLMESIRGANGYNDASELSRIIERDDSIIAEREIKVYEYGRQ